MTWCIIANGRPIQEGLEVAVATGASLLKEGQSAVNAVTEAIRILENDPRFDAGIGCDMNLNGLILMDASIMEGKNLNGGAIGAVSGIKNPILVAKKVMDIIPNVFLVGKHAEDFAKKLASKYPEIVVNFDASTIRTRKKLIEAVKVLSNEMSIKEILKKSTCASDVIFQLLLEGKLEKVRQRLNELNHGTVSVVALDQNGNFSAGASTGGWTLGLPGRIGDSPLLGCGAYADNDKGAASTSGIKGEENVRLGGLTRIICDHMKNKISSMQATNWVTEYVHEKIGFTIKRGSLIAIDLQGKPGFNISHKASSQGVSYLREGMNKPRYLV